MIIFATVFGVGFALLISSLLFGHDDLGAVHGDIDDGSAGHGVLSLRMISLLMVGFGAAGFGVRATTSASMFQSSMAGIVGAAVVGAIGYFIIRAFYANQESSTITEQDIIGCSATLIDAIAPDGVGQVSCVLRGRGITYMARSKNGQAIRKGAPVRVISKAGNTVTVEPIEDH